MCGIPQRSMMISAGADRPATGAVSTAAVAGTSARAAPPTMAARITQVASPRIRLPPCGALAAPLAPTLAQEWPMASRRLAGAALCGRMRPMPGPALADLATKYDAWLRDAALPLWAGDGYDALADGFREALDEAGRPVDGPVRLRVQARQTWVYAQAGRTGWPGPWRERV